MISFHSCGDAGVEIASKFSKDNVTFSKNGETTVIDVSSSKSKIYWSYNRCEDANGNELEMQVAVSDGKTHVSNEWIEFIFIPERGDNIQVIVQPNETEKNRSIVFKASSYALSPKLKVFQHSSY